MALNLHTHIPINYCSDLRTFCVADSSMAEVDDEACEGEQRNRGEKNV